jgi:hypothetical protein
MKPITYSASPRALQNSKCSHLGKFETKCESKENENMKTTNSTGSQPEKKFRAGAISATVWLNQGVKDNGEASQYRTISLQRGYKDKNNQWQNTTSLRLNDIPRAALMLTKAYEFLVTKHDEVVTDTNAIKEEIVM